MKRYYALWALVGFAFTSLFGTLLHFLYDWLGKAVWLAPFSGVNESTWEHMKLLFWPMLAFAAVEGAFFRNREDFWCIKCRGILLGITLIPVLFYTYNGVIGTSPDFINIAIFFICAAISYLYETRQFNREIPLCRQKKLPVALLCLIGALFVIFTFKAPQIGIFKDPITGAFGIQ